MTNVRRIEDYPFDTWREKQLKPRSRTWVKQIRVSFEVEPYSETIDEYAERVRLIIAEHDLEDAYLTQDTDYGAYGDRDRDVVYVKGWRNATEDEIAAVEETATRHRARRAEHEAQRIADAKQLMKERPELFK